MWIAKGEDFKRGTLEQVSELHEKACDLVEDFWEMEFTDVTFAEMVHSGGRTVV